jgi:hypothetical protein
MAMRSSASPSSECWPPFVSPRGQHKSYSAVHVIVRLMASGVSSRVQCRAIDYRQRTASAKGARVEATAMVSGERVHDVGPKV